MPCMQVVECMERCSAPVTARHIVEIVYKVSNFIAIVGVDCIEVM